MNFGGLNEPQFRRRLVGFVIILLATAGTCNLMVTVASGDWFSFVLWLLAAALLAWTFLSKSAWWLLMPVAIGFGGLFYFGFRLYLYEIVLVVCFLPLLPQLATGQKIEGNRGKLPPVIYFLIVYMTLHLLVSCYLAKSEGAPMGSIVRVYGKGMWPLIFAVLFYARGSTRHLKWALHLFLWAALARSILGVVGYFIPQAIASVMGFILPGLYSEGVELRESGLWVIYLSLTVCSLMPRLISKLFYMAVVLLAFGCVALGGGRTGLAMAAGILLMWAFWQKKFVLLIAVLCGVGVILGVFNADPEMIYKFPKRFQRTFSILVFQSPFQNVHDIVEGSNEWHYELMQRGYRKWVDTPLTILFGNRVVSARDMSSFYQRTFFERVQIAENMAAYESGLWTILATLGVVGFVMYFFLFKYLLGPVMRSLWRTQIIDYPSAFAFLAVASTTAWAIFCWVAGHFPSEPLMLAVIARAAYADQQHRDVTCAS
jgi:hypothetical protein